MLGLLECPIHTKVRLTEQSVESPKGQVELSIFGKGS